MARNLPCNGYIIQASTLTEYNFTFLISLSKNASLLVNYNDWATNRADNRVFERTTYPLVYLNLSVVAYRDMLMQRYFFIDNFNFRARLTLKM